MAQVNLFNSGLNIRLSPQLLSESESVNFINVDNAIGSLGPVKLDTDEGVTVEPTIFNFKDAWISGVATTDVVEFQDVLYISDGVQRPIKSSDGVTFHYLGITAPTSAPPVSDNGSGSLSGTYQYCYTYYNEDDGTESAQSPYSAEQIYSGFNVTVVASTDLQVSGIRLYRLGGALSSMTLVTTLTNANQTYTDTVADVDISGNHILDAYNNQPAPGGLAHLVEANAMLFGSLGPKLYYSDIAEPNYWSEFNFIDLDADITGIGAVSNGLLVFTEYKTYIITGTSPEVLSKYILDSSQGCLSHKSIGYFTSTLVWLSSDGICVSAGSTVEVASRDKLGKLSLTPKAAIVYDDQYFLSHEEGTLSLDIRFGSVLKEQDINPDGWHIYNDVLYYSLDGKLYSHETSEDKRTFSYTGPKYSEGSLSKLKNYKTIYTYSEGYVELKVYTDKGLLSATVLDEGYTEVKLPQDKRLGYWMQFEISGTGTLHEIEYTVEARQNGR